MARLVPSCLMIVIALAGTAAGQARNQLPYGKSELLRFALHKKGFKPLTEREWFDGIQEHKDILVVVIGDTSTLVSRYFPRNNFQEFRDLVANGGAVLIASDSPSTGRGNLSWGTHFGIGIDGQKIAADPQKSYRNNIANRPFVKPRAKIPFARDDSPFAVFEGVQESGVNGVATDQPSQMTIPARLPGFIVNPLADYPQGSRRIRDGGLVGEAENHFAVSIRTDNDQGRMIVLANRNVFANGMMGFTPKGDGDYELDNGNWEFAKRTIDWLQGGLREHKRTQCLFIEDGRIIDKFADTIAQPKPPLPNIDPEILANWALNRANAVIPWAEESNYFNRLLEGWVGYRTLVRLFLVIMTIVFIAFAMRWLRRSLRKAEPTSTLTKSVQAGLLPRGGVLRQRTAAQFEVGNLYEAARRRVRSRFDVLGGRPGADGEMPPVLTANDLPDGPVIYQGVRWLWAVGYGETPVTVPPTEWDRLNALLERVSARAARGDWSFGQDV